MIEHLDVLKQECLVTQTYPRFLVRLLLVHGTLADYRLGRLIKYSFYKNIAFAFMLFFFQFFCAYSGQALLDGITAVRLRVSGSGCQGKYQGRP